MRILLLFFCLSCEPSFSQSFSPFTGPGTDSNRPEDRILFDLARSDTLETKMNRGLSGGTHIGLGSTLFMAGFFLALSTDSMDEGDPKAQAIGGAGLILSTVGIVEIIYGICKKPQ